MMLAVEEERGEESLPGSLFCRGIQKAVHLCLYPLESDLSRMWGGLESMNEASLGSHPSWELPGDNLKPAPEHGGREKPEK